MVVLLILSFHNRQQHNSKPKGKRTSILFHPILKHFVKTGSCRVSQISCQGRPWLVCRAAYKDWSGTPGMSMELVVQLSLFSRLILLVAPALPRSRPHPQTNPCSRATPHTGNHHRRSLLSKGKLPYRLYTLKTGKLDGIPDHLSEFWRKTSYRPQAFMEQCIARMPWVDRGAWWAAVHGVAQSRTWLKQLSMCACRHWRRKWQPTPVFLPGESQGQRSLVGCHLWGRAESDTTDMT